MNTEEDGSTAPYAYDSVSDLTETPTPAYSKPDSFAVRGFQKGHDPRRNTAGRPKKADTFAERYRRAVEKDAKSIIKAHVTAAKGSGMVASKERALVFAYAMGRPVQPYVNVGGDDPLTALFTEIAERRQLPQTTTDNDQT